MIEVGDCMKEAMYYKVKGNSIYCELCPRYCKINDGETGKCRVRKHIKGKLYALGYGRLVSAHVDPIEKKPLYHFYPKSDILSVGFSSCNMTCPFCQNYELSQSVYEVEEVSIERLMSYVDFGIAFTYNEPLINYEYIYEFSKRLKALSPDKKIVLVTNGMINQAPLEELLNYVDAINLDFKGLSNFYKFCGGNYDTLVKNLKLMNKVHLEVTTLMVTGSVDLEAIKVISKVIADVNPKIPFHLSRYFPQYLSEAPATDLALMTSAKLIASENLEYVYLWNIGEEQNTYCTNCHQLLIQRYRFNAEIKYISCPCDYDNNIRSKNE